MFIGESRIYYREGNQCCGLAPFLIMMQSERERGCGPGTIRCLVRKVALTQCGHWMMGSARVKGHRIGISGSYGGDGLAVTVPHEIWELGVPLPDHLFHAWNKGEGWNGAGKEAPLIRQWALDNLLTLSKPLKKGGKK